MRLKAREIAALLPLLRPNVEIEIVLHATADDVPLGAVAPLPDLTVKPRGRRWTPEARAAHGEKIRQRKAARKAAVDVPPIDVPATEPTTVVVKAFADGGTPDQQQAAAFRAAAEQARAAKKE